MGTEKGLPRTTAENFCRNYGENVPTRTIARGLFQKYPEIYTDIEHARNIVRKIRGNHGDLNRKWNSDKTQFRTNRTPEEVGREYNLSPIDITIKDFEFPHFKPLILSDIHLPYHDLQAVIIALEKGIEKGVDSIYLNGDILDCYLLSRFLKEGGMPSFNDEREMFWELIDFIREMIDVPIFFKVGNHEERWEHYIQRQAGEIQDLQELTLRNVLRLDELNIQYIEGRQKCNMGKLIVIHGHEFGESIFSPVNPSRGLFLKAKSSTLAGHNHQTSEHHENNLKGDSMACFSTGAL